MLKLHPRLAPIKVAVLPLVRKDGQPELAHEVFESLRGQLQAEYDEGGSIGKRYRRQDEIGTPFCVTIDHQSLEDRTVTVRDRDSLAQERVAIDELPAVLGARLAAPWRTPKLAEAERRPWPSPRVARSRCRRSSSSCAGVALSRAGLHQRPAGRVDRLGRGRGRRQQRRRPGRAARGHRGRVGAIPRALRSFGQVRAWHLLGGLGGAMFIAAGAIGAPEIGVALLSVALVCGQTTGSLAADGVGLSPAGAPGRDARAASPAWR